MKDLEIWRLAKECLEAGTPVMLLQVLDSWGSSPGRQGFRMVVAADGRMAGSIGGGIMEHKLVELGRHRLAQGNALSFYRKQIHSKNAARDQSGMICSGEQTVAFLPILPDWHEEVEAIGVVLEQIEQKQKVAIHLSNDGIVLTERQPKDFWYALSEDDEWVYVENLGLKDTLYIIGGGHVGLAFSRQMALLDFNLVLIDDREGLNTFEGNNWVHRKLTSDYTALAEVIPPGPNTYIAIMTFGYRPDKVALTALLGREYAYLGLMGSEAKIAQMWKEFREEGVPETELARVHSPIGLPIHSRTPEEISVSIAAQIVLVRNQNYKDSR